MVFWLWLVSKVLMPAANGASICLASHSFCPMLITWAEVEFLFSWKCLPHRSFCIVGEPTLPSLISFFKLISRKVFPIRFLESLQKRHSVSLSPVRRVPAKLLSTQFCVCNGSEVARGRPRSMHCALGCRFHDSSHAPSKHVHTHRLLANQLSSFHCFSNLTIAKFASAAASSICPSQRSLRCVPAERRPNRALTKLQATLSIWFMPLLSSLWRKKKKKKEREQSISQRKSYMYKTLFKRWYATVDSAELHSVRMQSMHRTGTMYTRMLSSATYMRISRAGMPLVAALAVPPRPNVFTTTSAHEALGQGPNYEENALI